MPRRDNVIEREREREREREMTQYFTIFLSIRCSKMTIFTERPVNSKNWTNHVLMLLLNVTNHLQPGVEYEKWV